MFDIKKFVEEIKAMTVIELNDVVKALEEEFGVSAAAVSVGAGAGAGAAAAVVEEQTEFNVILKDGGTNKIAVIKVIREITGLGLVEAKKMAESAPITIKEGASKETADEIVAKFKESGATIEVK